MPTYGVMPSFGFVPTFGVMPTTRCDDKLEDGNPYFNYFFAFVVWDKIWCTICVCYGWV